MCIRDRSPPCPGFQLCVCLELSFILCLWQVYHPNIDLEGNVCLNILREDWKPVLNINTVIYGLFHLFTVVETSLDCEINVTWSMLCIYYLINFFSSNQIMKIL